jgi:hypothetical protein
VDDKIHTILARTQVHGGGKGRIDHGFHIVTAGNFHQAWEIEAAHEGVGRRF